MKLELEIPDDWRDHRHIHVMVGLEVFAYQYDGYPLMVKKQGCVRCGLCCKIKEKCEHLVYEGEIAKCLLGWDMPLACAVSHSPTWIYCKQRFEAK